ncbi:AraC family transcriptional regulator [Clostridium folliculivorans]|uniref:AraC family transcriptional regulator n=1 Tax=Clostridium folliculivorans TaxID=2886038 RepID=A0A9W6DCE2_9CLOT|nr:AraC family transcriptional regulator [Clostridium folliculivorans]GKU27405.1 AraC family transcriptional regulator [Clostridium folliculivorans]GKU32256.1 AraC family transcriptional regulator [Clostridium folliculivorans]
MNYYHRIQNSIEFIELNLDQNIDIVDIASKAYFSAFHFQRIFQAISGFSVQSYIRKRRMTEAAILLKRTDKTILEISITFQYGSQEAFTRAFESSFGITPYKYRKSQEISINLIHKINFMDYEKKIQGDLEIDKPEIINCNKIYIAGYEYKTNLIDEQYFSEIPRFYDDFGKNEYYMRISERIAPAFSHGISCNYQDDGQFSFIVGEAVRCPSNGLEDGFVNLEIPEGKYAVFNVCGSVEIAQNTWRYIYKTWMPNSNYERREGPDFEVTDVCSSIYPDMMKMKIYIPVK